MAKGEKREQGNGEPGTEIRCMSPEPFRPYPFSQMPGGSPRAAEHTVVVVVADELFAVGVLQRRGARVAYLGDGNLRAKKRRRGRPRGPPRRDSTVNCVALPYYFAGG